MSRGVDRQPIFFDVDDRMLFGELLGATVNRFGIEVHAYCLMTNHFHLLVRCPAGGLSEGMQWLLSMYATRMNRRLERVGHLFGGRFVSRLITQVGYLANVVRYIHLNPLVIDGVDRPADYRWSSHRTYLGLRPVPRWFETRTVATWFAGASEFDRFVCVPLATPPSPTVYPPDPSEFIDAVDFVVTEQSPARARELLAQRRAVSLSIADTAPQSVGEQIYAALGIRSSGARRSAKHRARRLRAENPLVETMAAQTCLLFAGDHIDPTSSAA